MESWFVFKGMSRDKDMFFKQTPVFGTKLENASLQKFGLKLNCISIIMHFVLKLFKVV